MSSRLLAPAVLAALAAAGCGGGGGDDKRSASTKPAPRATPSVIPTTPPATTPEPTLREERSIVEGWANALARSDVDRATTYFSLPAVVEQGDAFRLRRRAQVRLFNDGLPCGARVIGAERQAGFLVASFRLKERPGHTCDSPGGTARVAFRFRDGKISEWRQVPDPPDPAPVPTTES
jgi:hypothetical protein